MCAGTWTTVQDIIICSSLEKLSLYLPHHVVLLKCADTLHYRATRRSKNQIEKSSKYKYKKHYIPAQRYRGGGGLDPEVTGSPYPRIETPLRNTNPLNTMIMEVLRGSP